MPELGVTCSGDRRPFVWTWGDLVVRQDALSANKVAWYLATGGTLFGLGVTCSYDRAPKERMRGDLSGRQEGVEAGGGGWG